MPTLNVQNRTLFHGDNLPFLRGINSNIIHLIATDPPFNKGRDFHATPDSLAAGAKFEDRWSWDKDVHQDWIDAIQDDWPAVWQVIEAARAAAGEDMAAYLCWLGVRLLEMHRVLRDDGSLYLHCDPTASHYLKSLLDAIFGRKQFLSELVWKRTASQGSSRRWGPIHDTILLYAKSNSYTWNRVYQPYDQQYLDDYYRHEDSRGRHQHVSLTAPEVRSGHSGKPWRNINPTDTGRHWAVPRQAFRNAFPNVSEEELSPQEMLDLLDEAGLIYWPKRGKMPRQKRYADENPGVLLQDTVTDIRPLGSHAKERLGYPTQKPLALYERLLEASSNEGDIVLDPFCGCATTPVAAERLARQWVGMDFWEKAHQTVIDRLQDEGLAGPDGNTAGRLLTFGQIFYSTAPPIRSDDGETGSPILKTKQKIAEPPGPKMSRAEMVKFLIEQNGMVCQGCDRQFDDPLYLELDHNTPRSDGGLNHISNRLLLCGPCNRIKSNTLTLSGLRKENTKRGRMAAIRS